MQKTKVRIKQYILDKNPIESGRSIVAGVAKSVGSDVAKGMSSDFLRFMGLGATEKNQKQELSGDLMEGQELNLKDLKKEEQKTKSLEIEAGEAAVEYQRAIRHGESIATGRATQEIKTNVQHILTELRRLIQTTKELQVEFKEVAIEQRVVNPGKYHQTFFEWMLSVVKQARMKIEDSGAWLSATKGKHAKKQQYWAMFKKHGTTFGLSNERVVATQTG